MFFLVARLVFLNSCRECITAYVVFSFLLFTLTCSKYTHARHLELKAIAPLLEGFYKLTRLSDMQLSSRCYDCWSSHTLSAMTGLTQFYTLKERLLMFQPIDFARIVVDLRDRYLDYWAPYSDTCPRERKSNAPLIINSAPSLHRGPCSCVHHTSFPDTCFLTFLRTLSTAWHA